MTTSIPSTVEAVFRDVFDDALPAELATLQREDLESWDSLGHMRLVSALEEAFSVSFSIDEIEGLTSVAAIVQTLSAKA